MRFLTAFIISLQLMITPVLAEEGSSKINLGDAAKTVLSMASGVVGTKILTHCPSGTTQPSVLIYFAGALTYIGKEIVNGFAQGASINEQSSSVEGGNEQIDIIRKQLKNEENNLRIIKNKKVWETAITVAYTVASLSAVVEGSLALTGKPDSVLCNPTGTSNTVVVKAIEKAYLSADLFRAGQGAVSSLKSGNVMAIVGTAATAKNSVEQVKMLFGVVDKTSSTTMSTVGKYFSNGFVRAGVFGAFATVSGLVVGDLREQQKKAEKNVEDLRKVIAEMGKTTGTTAITEGEGSDTSPGGDPSSPDKKTALKELPDVKVPKNCWSNQSGQPEFTEGACKSPMRLPKPVFNSNLNLPTLTIASNAVMEMGQAVSDGDMGKANLAAGNLASMAAKIKDLTESVEKKINEDLKAKGKPALNLKKDIASRVAELEKSMQDAAKASGASLASSEAKLQPETKETAAPAPVVVTAPEEALPTDIALSLNEDTPAEAPSTPLASLDESLGQYEDTTQDISKKSDVSIFTQLSHRYLLNYTKIFEAKKSLDPDKK